jgi:acyl-CoA dehydrogenase
MSVPYKIEAMENLLVGGKVQPLKASEKIPIIARPFVSERAKKTLDIVRYHL